MAQEPQHEHAQQSQTSQKEDDDEVADLEMELECNGFYDKIYSMAEKFATTNIGQFVIERCDRLLRSIEDTAKWSLPQESMEGKLVRPFNWIFFLTLIVALRFIRIGLSIGSLMIGNSPVSAYDMVYFLQTRRRKLRAIRIYGLKEIQRRELEEHAIKCGTQSTGFTGKISALLSIAICRPGQHREPGRRVFIRRGRMQECVEPEDTQACKRRRDDDNSDLNLTFDQMLSKYADENSEDDPDFEPNPEEESSDDSSSSDSEISAAEDQTDEMNREHLMSNDKEAVKSTKDANNITAPTDNNNKSQLNKSVEIKENGNGTHQRPMPKPLMYIKREPLSDIDSGTEQQQSPNVLARNGNNDAESQKSTAPQMENNSSPPNNYNNLNVRQEDDKKSTPGHETAAIIKPAVIPALNATATLDPNNDVHQSSIKPSSFLPNFALLPPSLSALAESRKRLTRRYSHESIECITRRPPPPTPPPSPRYSVSPTRSTLTVRIPEIHLSDFESSSLVSASSTEDIFYSPIGSPTDLNACFKPVSILKNPIVPTLEAVEAADAHSTPKSPEDIPESPPTDASSSSSPPKKHVHHQQPHRNRNRGKNRR